MMGERPCGCPCCAPPATEAELIELFGPDILDDDPALEDITFYD